MELVLWQLWTEVEDVSMSWVQACHLPALQGGWQHVFQRLRQVSTPSAVTCWLALRMQCVDVHRKVEFISDDLLVLACEFVGTVDAFGVPVCPVQTVLKHGDSKRVWEACNDVQ